MSGSIPPWAVKGAKVVCIKPKPAGKPADWIYPVVGEVYTIRRVKPVGYGGLSEPIVMLAEINNSHIKPEPYEPGYALDGFRPLITRTQEQDVALFEPLLTPSKPSERISDLTDDELETQAREAVFGEGRGL